MIYFLIFSFLHIADDGADGVGVLGGGRVFDEDDLLRTRVIVRHQFGLGILRGRLRPEIDIFDIVIRLQRHKREVEGDDRKDHQADKSAMSVSTLHNLELLPLIVLNRQGAVDALVESRERLGVRNTRDSLNLSVQQVHQVLVVMCVHLDNHRVRA